MIELQSIRVTDFDTNCYLVNRLDTRSCIIVDPGGDIDIVMSKLRSEDLRPAAILLTHSHLDHAGGVALLKKSAESQYGTTLPLYAHKEDLELLYSITKQASLFGFDSDKFQDSPTPDVLVEDDSDLSITGITIKVLHTPGHTAGHVCFYFANSKPFVLSGDTLFKSSVGRTDLPGGNHNLLIKSIKEKLLVLPDETIVYPGHGPQTDIYCERISNPFLQAASIL
ncbi:MAG: MBL fold metallo-hydrolase [Deltaproteobacteria bacterium]|nr:MBL fold metallo-hydrolase [Deltaproteobacteria bacterium]